MFGGSSKTAKCKTQLKIVVSRIKILRNKREVQVKHLRRDVAQLLGKKQDANARARAEHAIREQNMVDAYTLIEGYCTFLEARVQSMSGQKELPSDLKEAVASLIYAGPRCAELPELLEIRSIITSKFGKQFIATIVELRAGCGVSKMIVEKLSTQSIPTTTKLKFMHEVAKEHNISWQPEELSAGDEDLKQAPVKKAPAVVPITIAKIHQDQNSSPTSPLGSSTTPGYEANSEPDDSDDEKHELPSPVPVAQAQPVAQQTQFIPFLSSSNPAPDPYGKFSRGIVNPYAQQSSQQMPGQQMPDPYAEYQRKFMKNTSSSPLLDVASAAEAAADSADQAAAAARAAANLANKHLSRQSSLEVSSRPVSRKVSPVNLEDRVASYLQTHLNDGDSSEWDTPHPREKDEGAFILNPSRNLAEERKKLEETAARQQGGYRVDKRLSVGAARARQGVDPDLFRVSDPPAIGKPVFESDHRPRFDEPQVARVESFDLRLEDMNESLMARTEKLFEKEDSDDSPVSRRHTLGEVEQRRLNSGSSSRREREVHDGDGDDSDLVARFNILKKKGLESGVASSDPGQEEESYTGLGRRRSEPPPRLPPTMEVDEEEKKHLDFRRRFHGAGVDYSEHSSLAAKKTNRFGTSVRTRRS